MRKIIKKVGTIAFVLFFLCVSFFVVAQLVGFKTYLVANTKSMEPKLNHNDLIFIKKHDYNKLKVGDCVAFKYKRFIITHEIVEVTDGPRAYKTRGLNNPVYHTELVTQENYLGKYRFKSKALGHVFAFIKSPVTKVFGYWRSEQVPKQGYTALVEIGRWNIEEEGFESFDHIIFELLKADPLQNFPGTIHIGIPNQSQIKRHDILLIRDGDVIKALQVMTDDLRTDVFTRANAPVSSQWLARHDNVTSSPSIGTDWFRVSPTWVNQDYPVGSFVQRDGRHYRMAVNGQWEEVPEAIKPATIPNAHLVPEFDPSATVQWHVTGRAYVNGDFVRANVNGQILYYRCVWGASTTAPLTDANAWRRVNDWNEISGIQDWSPAVFYDANIYGGTIVKYTNPQGGISYHRRGSDVVPIGQAPPNAPQPWMWTRIMTWEETSKPLAWSTRDYNGWQIVQGTNGNYYVHVHGYTDPGNSALPAGNTNDRWRIVPLWTQGTAQQYFVQSNAGNGNWGSSNLYFTYTMQDGVPTFWRALQNQTSSQIAPPDSTSTGNTHWQRYDFPCHENMVVTRVGDEDIIWRKITTSIYPGAPSTENRQHWERHTISVSDTFVVTIAPNGYVSLWQRSGGATIVPPGQTGGPWTSVNYRTGISDNTVYIMTGLGQRFYRSTTQSSRYPGGEGWVELNPTPTQPGNFVYSVTDGVVSYYQTNLLGGIRKLSPAWIGGGSAMIYHFQTENTYTPGDIVVYGSTLTNTYRYFQMRTGVNGAIAKGKSPMSDGKEFWQPISILTTGVW